MYSDELYHHGILGMKWGVRNGPPYPLDSKAHSARERKAGWRKSLKRKSNYDEYRKASRTKEKESDWTSKAKEFVNSKGFKIAAGVAIVGAGAYVASKYGKSFVRIQNGPARQALVDGYRQNHQAIKTNIIFEWRAKSEGISLSQLEKKINKELSDGFKNANLNYAGLPNNFGSLKNVPKSKLNFAKKFFSDSSDNAFTALVHGINGKSINTPYDFMLAPNGRKNNCTFCTASIAMRMKGYDVSAAETQIGVPSYMFNRWFKGSKNTKITPKDARELYNTLLSQGEGHYGALGIGWKAGGGHSVFYVIKNGALEIIDGQQHHSYGRGFDQLDANIFSHVDFANIDFSDLTYATPTDKIIKAVMKNSSRASSLSVPDKARSILETAKHIPQRSINKASMVVNRFNDIRRRK